MITTEEARQKKLGGYDVFRSDQIAYVSSDNRDWVVSQICHQANLMICDTAFLQHHSLLMDEVAAARQWIAEGKDLRTHAPPSADVHFFLMARRHLDFFKIGSAIELGLKAHLLHYSLLIHYLDREEHPLYRKQAKEPIAIQEFLSHSQSYFDGERNVFPDLSEKTLTFDRMLRRDGYRQALPLNASQMTFCNELRMLRNMVHLPLVGASHQTPFIRELGEHFYQYLVSFLNELVIDLHNKVVAAGRELPRISL